MYLPIKLDRNLPEPLQDQLFSQMQRMIVNGNLKPNTQVIATRFLAEQVDVSRTTVLLVYERLISEGYLETRPGIGTFVSADLPDDEIKARGNKKNLDVKRQASLYPPSYEGGESARQARPSCRIDFGLFNADPALLPLKAWGQKIQAVAKYHSQELSEYPPQAGIDPLKAAIGDWLSMHRNIVVSPEQVIIVAGRQQARHLVARLFLRSGGKVVIEAPCLSDTAVLFEAVGATLIPVPVDDQGLRVDLLPEGRAHLAYVTPNHQRPLGGTLSLRRRELLIEWARKSGSYIIEDDCDGKFRYDGAPLPALAALDDYGLVFHLGTFSKTLGAGLCLGYLVVPPEFIEPVTALKSMFSKGCSWLDQRILADFMSSGDYDQHLRKMRKVYMDRRNCLIESLKANFGDVQLIGTETGTQLTFILPGKAPSAQEIQKRALAQGVGIRTLADSLYEKNKDLPNDYLERAIILGYSTLDEEQIREGISVIYQIVNG